MQKKNKYIIIILLLIIVSILVDIILNDMAYIDRIDYMFYRSDILTSIMLIITNLGSTVMMIILGILCLLFIKNRNISLFLVFNLISISIISSLLKYIVKRGRPDISLLEVNTYSYPSGHSLVSLTFYGMLIYFVRKSNINIKLKTFITILLSLIIFLIALSRIYLGVHYPSDVISGLLIGIIYLIIVLPIYNKYFNS